MTSHLKFPRLPLGQRFEFRGELFIKTGPVVATHVETGRQKFMPRFAEVLPADAPSPDRPPPDAAPQVGRRSAIAACEVLYGEGLAILENLHLPDDRIEELRQRLSAARRRAFELL